MSVFASNKTSFLVFLVSGEKENKMFIGNWDWGDAINIYQRGEEEGKKEGKRETEQYHNGRFHKYTIYI